MITNKVYRLRADATIAKGVDMKASQEIEVVQDVVYVNGYPVPPAMQQLFLNWITNNPELFEDDTRDW